MNPDKIGNFIYKLRTEKGLSQYQLADKIPITRQAVSKWERGRTIPDSSTLIRLSEIFDVTINELLQGERISEDSIENLQKTTLGIIDDNNRKTNIIRKAILSSIIIITSLLLLFLGYYFINSYNTIKVYRITSNDEIFPIPDGIMIITNRKQYIKIGKIYNPNDFIINSVKLYYEDENRKIVFYEGEDIDNIIQENFGYSEYFIKKNPNDYISNIYLEIRYNDIETKQIKLSFRRDFTNNQLFPSNNHKITSKEERKVEAVSKEQNEIDSALEYIKEHGIETGDTYRLEYNIEEIYYQILYLVHQGLISCMKNGNPIWNYDIKSDYYICIEENIDTNTCKQMVLEDLKLMKTEGGN